MPISKIQVRMNSDNVREYLRSESVEAMLRAKAEAIAAAAGDGFVAESMIGQNRARASVRTDTVEAMRAEAESHLLSRAIEAGRG